MKRFAIGTMILLVGALVGCSSPDNAQVNPELTTNEQGTAQNTGEAKMLTEEEAIDIVNKEIPGGKIVKIEHDLDSAIPDYDFKVIKDNIEYELYCLLLP